jgi:hypothetical protein
VGLVAPRDKVAVYMGYAFLYGVIGSLVGSNFGAVMYAKILNPVTPPAELVASGLPLSSQAMGQIRLFWLMFAGLGLVCLAGMLLYNRFFSQDTPLTNRRAWRIMQGIYGVIFAAGVVFLVDTLLLADLIRWNTFVQSLIMIFIGGGGLVLSLRQSPRLGEKHMRG